MPTVSSISFLMLNHRASFNAESCCTKTCCGIGHQNLDSFEALKKRRSATIFANWADFRPCLVESREAASPT